MTSSTWCSICHQALRCHLYIRRMMPPLRISYCKAISMVACKGYCCFLRFFCEDLRKTYPLFTKVHVVSEADAVYLRKLDPHIDVRTIPISIDGLLLGKVQRPNKAHAVSGRRPIIICTGNLGNSAISQGVDNFLRIAFPHILKYIPNIRFVVHGKNARTSLLRRHETSVNIEFCSWVDNYQDFMGQADVVLVPDSEGPPGPRPAWCWLWAWFPVVGSVKASRAFLLPIVWHVTHQWRNVPDNPALLSDNERARDRQGGARIGQLQSFLSKVGPEYESLYLGCH